MSATHGAPSLETAFRLLHADPAEAERSCKALIAVRDDPAARLMLAAARRMQGDAAEAEKIARALAASSAGWAGAHFEHGMALGRLGRHADALAAFVEVERLGGLPGLWREVGDQHWAQGDAVRAEQAYLRHLESRALEPVLHDAMAALASKDDDRAERAFRLQLERYGDDVLALRHYAEHCSRLGRYEEAEALLRRCLERAPGFALGRYGLAMVLLHAHAPTAAIEEAERLLSREPGRLEYLLVKADALGHLGDFEAAAQCLETILAKDPQNGGAWTSYGHALRAIGRRSACEAAYRRAIATGVSVGEASWGLANLKTYRFSPEEIGVMRKRCASAPEGADRVALTFAIGKALEDSGDTAGAFEAYAMANRERRMALGYDHAERVDALERSRAVFTQSFFAERTGWGAPDADPIFIVGMPRSGSTLVEQILASHPAVEGTMELLDMLMIARRIAQAGSYPEALQGLDADALAALGREYLKRTSIFRKTAAPRFVDKMPNNFQHVGLIHLVLPNARIVDVRRHPLACGFSNFRQHWATGQSFAYNLADIGRYYSSYVALMAHFDAVLPGRVHRVIYEDLVAQPEVETRRLLDACDLAFDPGCLRFFENTRAVRTPSSEQVRRPINAEGLDGWKPFEPWLGPLKDALGPVLDSYPAAPPA